MVKIAKGLGVSIDGLIINNNMSTFTLPFPEYDIADILQREFPKKDDYSIAIPLSRQQKFYDLLLVNGVNKKIVTIQVKSSRTYLGKVTDPYQYYSWLNLFDVKENYSDFYFIYMTYPVFDKQFRPKAKWNRKILVFTQKEMVKLLDNVKTKSGKTDHFFSFGFFMSNSKICGVRGFHHLNKCQQDFSKNLMENKLGQIRQKLQ